MIIDSSNIKIIDSKEVCIHDDILEGFFFNRSEKKLYLSLIKEQLDCPHYSIDFINVIGFEMTSCDFWGPSPQIWDIEYVEKDDNIIIPKVFKMKEDNCPYCTLSDREKYFEIVIVFISGDRLRIACERIII